MICLAGEFLWWSVEIALGLFAIIFVIYIGYFVFKKLKNSGIMNFTNKINFVCDISNYVVGLSRENYHLEDGKWVILCPVCKISHEAKLDSIKNII